MVEEEQHLEDWIPSTRDDQHAVRLELARMLENPLFRNSKRYPNLLRYLVEETLAGNEAHLKERLLGITVFHRAPDYDTNQDTVVRLTAGEIRKRIAQYYHQPGHTGELQIDLRPGSYVPVFRRASPAAASNEPALTGTVEPAAERHNPAPSPAPDSESNSTFTGPLALPGSVPLSSQSNRGFLPKGWSFRRRTLAAALSLAMILLAAGTLTAWRATRAARSAENQLWAPILEEPGQAQLVIADLSATLGRTPPSGVVRTGDLTEILRMGELVNYRDILAQSGIVGYLAQHNKSYTIELSTQASYPDLQRGASVLIGGLDNVWTMRLTQPLRYSFVRRGASNTYAIVDRVHPELGGWNVDLGQPGDRVAEDFAIVARIFDQTTGRPVLVVAGLGANGTAAAAQFLLDPARTAELTARAPREWSRLNMEAVLRTQILDNHAGPPHLVACTFW